VHPGQLAISAFDYPLPDDLIARYPLAERDASRLLVSSGGNISDHVFRELPTLLPENAMLVFNNARVIPARLKFKKPTGGELELFLLSPHGEDTASALGATEGTRWKCLVGGAKKWKEGPISAESDGVVIEARCVEKGADGFIIAFSWNQPGQTFADILEQFGAIPLPPYLGREAEPDDASRYQTIFSHVQGSVAAPTAGLHFSQDIMSRLKQGGFQQAHLTLHVSAGTFKPVSADTISGHTMHSEFFEVSRQTLERIMAHPGPVIPIGTTAMRTLESLYWLGLRAATGKPLEQPVGQWEPYDIYDCGVDTQTALKALLEHVPEQGSWQHQTGILIAPGYTFRVCSGLFTNFHQPKSTLLLLVAALIGDHWKNVYRHAVEQRYRLLSYGDACLFIP
jgi:S-adenosylmethionine:tRNA ribosyltransferase-isomerase